MPNIRVGDKSIERQLEEVCDVTPYANHQCSPGVEATCPYDLTLEPGQTVAFFAENVLAGGRILSVRHMTRDGERVTRIAIDVTTL